MSKNGLPGKSMATGSEKAKRAYGGACSRSVSFARRSPTFARKSRFAVRFLRLDSATPIRGAALMALSGRIVAVSVVKQVLCRQFRAMTLDDVEFPKMPRGVSPFLDGSETIAALPCRGCRRRRLLLATDRTIFLFMPFRQGAGASRDGTLAGACPIPFPFRRDPFWPSAETRCRMPAGLRGTCR